MDETDQKAPVGASSMTLPVDAFAYEVLHGSRMVEDLFSSVMLSARGALKDRYPELSLRLWAVSDDLTKLIATAEQVWHAEAKRAEAGDAPTGTE